MGQDAERVTGGVPQERFGRGYGAVGGEYVGRSVDQSVSRSVGL